MADENNTTERIYLIGSSHSSPISSSPSRPEEFHLRFLTDPYVNLSIHTAPVSFPLAPLRVKYTHNNTRLLPVTWLATIVCELTYSLSSILITRISTLLQDSPPLLYASILPPSRGSLIGFSRNIIQVVPTFHTKARTKLTPSECRTPPVPAQILVAFITK